MSIDITMPRLSDTMESGTLLKWNVAEGDAVSSGDVVADVETDKATMELTVYDDGTMAKLLVHEGQTVDVGTTIALLAEEGEDVSSVASTGGAARDAKKPKDEQEPKDAGGPGKSARRAGDEEPDRDESRTGPAVDGAPAPAAAPATGAVTDERGRRRRVSPVARNLAEEHGLDLDQIAGSGPHGRIIKRDVLQAIETSRETAASIPPSAAPARRDAPLARAPVTPVGAAARSDADAAPTLGGRIALSSMRQTIAKRLVESASSIPHYQVSMTVEMDALMALRETLNAQLEPIGVKLSVNDFLVRACALAMYEHPDFNASWDGDGIVVHERVNIGIAISVGPERGGGLVVGVIRDADRKSLRAISAESKDLSRKARERGLSIEEMSDSTFTISNLGMFGVDSFTAIINPPNSAILAVGAAIRKPVVRDNALTIGWEMSATLSNDHRIIDGAMAARYLQTVRGFLENPATVMV